jgi:protein dithiol oxidoreductase (disulfide-forming)
MIDRRRFATVALGLATSLPAAAQWRFAEGTHFVRLSSRVPVAAGGKIDVVEFFWYGCPHCNAFEPTLEAWARRLPDDVALRRVHVAFTATHEMHSRIFYSLQQLGQLEAQHRRVFAAIHQQRLALAREDEIADFMQKSGVDRAAFVQAFRSPAVAAAVDQGKRLSDAYQIDGVPALGVAGRWYTSGSLAGGNDRMVQVADQLIASARKGG